MTQPSAIDWNALHRRLAESERAQSRRYEDDHEKIRAILDARAAALASRGARDRISMSTVRVVAFALGEEIYAVPLAALAGIVAETPLGAIPGAAAELAGVLYTRGEIWSIYDLRAFLGLPPTETSGAGFLLLMQDRQRRVGLRVDGAPGLRTVETQSLVDAGGNETAGSSGFVRGVTADGLVLIDDDALWAHPTITEIE